MATLRPLFSLGNKLFLRPANKGSGFLSMVQQHSNTTKDDSKKGGTDSKKGEKDSPKIIIPVDNDSLTRVDSKKGVTDSKKREKDSQKIIIPVDNDSLTREVQKLDRNKPGKKNAWGVLKERSAEDYALSQKIDEKKPKINSSLLKKISDLYSALSQKADQKKQELNSDLSKKVDQKEPKINSALAKKADQNKQELNSDSSQKVDQKEPKMNSTLTQKFDQKKPEKNSAYQVETELYYPNKTVSVPSTTLNLTSTVSVADQLKGIDAHGSLSEFVDKANEESEKAKEKLAQAEAAGGQNERDRSNKLHAKKNIETAKTLWGVGLYYQQEGDLLKARDNLLEAFDLALAIEGLESQEGLTQNYLAQDIEDALDEVLDLVKKEKKKGNIPKDA